MRISSLAFTRLSFLLRKIKGSRMRMEDSRGNERQVKDRRSSDKNFNHKWIGTQGSLFFLRSLKDFPSLSMQFPEKGRMREGEKRRWRENDTKAPRNDAMKGEIPAGLILDVSVCFPVSLNPFLLLLRILLQTELNNSEEKNSFYDWPVFLYTRRRHVNTCFQNLFWIPLRGMFLSSWFMNMFHWRGNSL